MRLIDADALKRKIYMQYDYSLGLYDGGTFIDTVEEESTVDAIPISFIEEMKAWAEENDFALYASDLNHLLLTWAERKEECGHQ